LPALIKAAFRNERGLFRFSMPSNFDDR
jgi:hypothetical protein